VLVDEIVTPADSGRTITSEPALTTFAHCNGLFAVVASYTVFAIAAAFAGATDRTPAPNAATATSAMRLRSVFVDMFFLSLVETGHFPISARRSC
jgi:hypothetical protein